MDGARHNSRRTWRLSGTAGVSRTSYNVRSRVFIVRRPQRRICGEDKERLPWQVEGFESSLDVQVHARVGAYSDAVYLGDGDFWDKPLDGAASAVGGGLGSSVMMSRWTGWHCSSGGWKCVRAWSRDGILPDGPTIASLGRGLRRSWALHITSFDLDDAF